MATRNVVLTAVMIEVRCPHCGDLQPGPDGAHAVDIATAKELCSGKRVLCVVCDEPIRMAWNDKVVTG